MITVQINLYALSYNTDNKDFDILSSNKDKLEIPSYNIDGKHNIKYYLDSILNSLIGEELAESKYRLFNNLIIDEIMHCLYFCLVSDNIKTNTSTQKLPVKDYAIHSPNIQKIMQLIR